VEYEVRDRLSFMRFLGLDLVGVHGFEIHLTFRRDADARWR
jgi:hypothetical protein